MESFFKKPKVKLTTTEYLRQRKLLMDRSGWRCARCGRILPLQRDHVKKRSQGGGDESENAQVLCATCHNEKDNVSKSKSEYWRKQCQKRASIPG